MTEIVRERTQITGPGMIELISRRYTILKHGWELQKQREIITEQLERLVGEQAILGKAFNFRGLSPDTRALIRQRGDIVARLIYNRTQSDLLEEDINNQLKAALCPEGEQPALLIVTPHDGDKEHIIWWKPKEGEDSLEGTFERMSGRGSFWMRDESDNSYLVKTFDDSDDRKLQVEIEIVYK